MFKKVFVNVVIGMVLSACGAWPSGRGWTGGNG